MNRTRSRAAEQFVSQPIPMWVGADPVMARSGDVFETHDPATGKAVATVARGAADDVDRAVRAARDAFDDAPRWAGRAPGERARILLAVADLIDTHLDELSELETLDAGKPLWMSKAEVAAAAEQFRYFAGFATKWTGDTVPGPDGRLTYSVREPVGVCGAIAPWNFPLIMAAQKAAPALAVGNTVVFKPAEQTPLTATRLVELALDADLPPGVLNVVHGFGPDVGEALVQHPGVDMVSFTGSTEVGRRIMSTAAGSLKKVSLELGGKSPNVVLADADLHGAARHAMHAVFQNTGQTCTAGSRLVVDERVHDEFVERLVDEARTQKVGHGLEPDTDLGPLISEEQRDRVSRYVDEAIGAGLEPALGGAPLSGDGYDDGSFYAPTVFTDVPTDAALARDEIFGPVLVTHRVDGVDEAIQVANDSRYGLAAGVWTESLRSAHRFAAGVKAGTVWINCYGLYDPAVSFGGVKESGFGRELGRDALLGYTQSKSVWVNYG